MRTKTMVLSIYPNAQCLFSKSFEFDKSEWRVYFESDWKPNGTVIFILLGIGKTKTQAWESAFKTIQKMMLYKLEHGIEAG